MFNVWPNVFLIYTRDSSIILHTELEYLEQVKTSNGLYKGFESFRIIEFSRKSSRAFGGHQCDDDMFVHGGVAQGGRAEEHRAAEGMLARSDVRAPSDSGDVVRSARR